MSLTSINVNNALVTSVDSEPTVGSDNLVKSGGVANITNALHNKTLNIDYINYPLAISDSYGNVIYCVLAGDLMPLCNNVWLF